MFSARIIFLFQAKTVTVYGVTRHTEEEIKEGMLNNILHKNTLYLQVEKDIRTVPCTEYIAVSEITESINEIADGDRGTGDGKRTRWLIWTKVNTSILMQMGLSWSFPIRKK